jgi:Holliday junction resolvase RusA-like endonuclease
MAIRMSEYDLKRIMNARKVATNPSKTPTKRKPSVKKAASSPAAPKRGRLQRIAYEGEEVTILIQMPPRPKERARTFVDMSSTIPRLITAFKAARGDVAKFAAAAKSAFSSGTVTPKETRQFEEAVAKVAADAMRGKEAFSVPVEVEYELAFEGEPGEWPTAGNDGDLDNLIKAVNDAMNKVVFTDDRLVVRSSEVKICSDQGFIRVTVRPARA